MATIKLQPSGNVLIKDGKVSCGCCVSCGCAITVPANLKIALDGVTSGTLYGHPSTYTEPAGFDGGWILEWDYINTQLDFFFTLNYDGGSCLIGTGTGIQSVTFLFSSPDCIDPALTTATGTFTINGIGPFTYYFVTGDNFFPEAIFLPPPVPNIEVS